MENVELNQCPKCNETNAKVKYIGDDDSQGSYWVQCGCGFRSEYFCDAEKAVENWNNTKAISSQASDSTNDLPLS